MSYTKRQIIRYAYAELGIADYAFDLQPEDWQLAAARLDAMIADWNGRGVRLGYPISSDPDFVNIDVDTGLPAFANKAVFCSLAVELAPGLGKTPTMKTDMAASSGFAMLLAAATKSPEVQFPQSTPAGSGNRWLRNNYLLPPIVETIPGPEQDTNYEKQATLP